MPAPVSLIPQMPPVLQTTLMPTTPTPDPLTLYSWRIKDTDSPWRNKNPKHPWRKLAWRMTEADALAWAIKQGCEIQVVEGSAQVIERLGSIAELLSADRK